MDPVILITIISLSLLALISAVILYFVAQKFKVFEDPRIDEVQDVLPAANCGGCGFAGCRNFAEALVKADTFEGLNCPVGGSEVMEQAAKKDRKIYVACSNCDKGGPARRACKVACIGCGKCVKVCNFDAITIENNLAYIDATKCTFCRKCVT